MKSKGNLYIYIH
jgi:hypothetical protein